MARMYSRKRGKSSSHKPEKPVAKWVDYKPREVEDLIIKYAKQELPSAKIGIILRDQYGIPSVKLATKKSLAQIMKENNLYAKLPEDMFDLLKRAVELTVHLEKNHKDYQSYRGLELTESKIRRLAKYYIKTGVLPANWKYSIDKAKLLIR